MSVARCCWKRVDATLVKFYGLWSGATLRLDAATSASPSVVKIRDADTLRKSHKCFSPVEISIEIDVNLSAPRFQSHHKRGRSTAFAKKLSLYTSRKSTLLSDPIRAKL